MGYDMGLMPRGFKILIMSGLLDPQTKMVSEKGSHAISSKHMQSLLPLLTHYKGMLAHCKQVLEWLACCFRHTILIKYNSILKYNQLCIKRKLADSQPITSPSPAHSQSIDNSPSIASPWPADSQPIASPQPVGSHLKAGLLSADSQPIDTCSQWPGHSQLVDSQQPVDCQSIAS